MKLCKDCKWCEINKHEPLFFSKCKSPSVLFTRRVFGGNNLISGDNSYYPCWEARKLDIFCGHSASCFEEKEVV